jgi:DNA-binding transcriptional MerR regulator
MEAALTGDGDSMRIGELARRTRMKMSTLREYERDGLIDADRSQGLHTRFPLRAIEQALQVRQMLAENLSVEEIKRLINWGQPNMIVSTGPGQTTRAIDLKELARQTGFSFTTLRYYIRHGLIEHLHSKANYLIFGESAVEQCHRVVQLRNLGLTLTEMKSMMEMFNFPRERDQRSLQLMSQRLEKVTGRMTLLADLEQRIRFWLDSEESVT